MMFYNLVLPQVSENVLHHAHFLRHPLFMAFPVLSLSSTADRALEVWGITVEKDHVPCCVINC